MIEQNTLFSAQDVKIQALDAANNPAEAEVKDFTITTNWFVRFVNSGWLARESIIRARYIDMYVTWTVQFGIIRVNGRFYWYWPAAIL